MRRINIKHMELMIALYEHKSYKQAAYSLKITAVAAYRRSRQIKEILGKDVIAKAQYPIEFTYEGLMLIELSKEVLRNIDKTINKIQNPLKF